MAVLSDDWQKFQQGDYIVVNNVWGKGSLVNGADYTQTITIDNTNDLSGGIHMAWNWNTLGTSVLSYPEVSVGYKPWDPSTTGTDALSTKISDIRAFRLSHDLSIGGTTDNFDVAYDLWLTNTPMGNEDTVTTELMIWTHKGGPDDFGTDPATNNSAIVGTYTHGGVTFDLVKYEDFVGTDSNFQPVHWRYLALVPQTDILDSSVDVRAIFTDLINRGYISESDYITGYELGAEIVGGGGSLDINDMSYKLGRYNADNHANTLTGTVGADRIFGLGGNDRIAGKGGNDWLVGGLGTDTLRGGQGSDTFVFNGPHNGVDTIKDFTPGKDHIALDSSAFTALTAGNLPASAFDDEVKDADTRLYYMQAYGTLWYDADGSGTKHSARMIAVLDHHVALTASDFIVL